MKLILDNRLKAELADRFSYMYDVFHTYMKINKKAERYIEASSFPEQELDCILIIGHSGFVAKYLTENKIKTEKLIVVSCGAEAIINYNSKNICCSEIYIARSNKSIVDRFPGEDFDFKFDVTESEIDLYNNRNKENKLDISFNCIRRS